MAEKPLRPRVVDPDRDFDFAKFGGCGSGGGFRRLECIGQRDTDDEWRHPSHFGQCRGR